MTNSSLMDQKWDHLITETRVWAQIGSNKQIEISNKHSDEANGKWLMDKATTGTK